MTRKGGVYCTPPFESDGCTPRASYIRRVSQSLENDEAIEYKNSPSQHLIQGVGVARTPSRMASAYRFQSLTTALLTDEERLAGTLSDENAAIAVHALHTDGIVCLENAVDLEHVAILRAQLASEVDVLLKLQTTHISKVSRSVDHGVRDVTTPFP